MAKYNGLIYTRCEPCHLLFRETGLFLRRREWESSHGPRASKELRRLKRSMCKG